MDRTFLLLAQAYSKHCGKSDKLAIHLPDVVNLLQGLGFYINLVDSCSPSETHPLKGNKKGVRIIISCNHSGQRYYLEQSSESCNCLKTSNDDSKETFWEVSGIQPSTANTSSFVETGSDSIPTISDSMKITILKVISALNQMIRDDQENLDISKQKRRSVNERSKSTSFLNDTCTSEVSESSKVPEIRVSSSPKYRSLDTLISTEDVPRATWQNASTSTKKPISNSESSVYISSEDLVSYMHESNPSLEDVLLLLKNAKSKISSVIHIIESSPNASTSCLNLEKLETENTLPLTPPLPSRSVSSPSLSRVLPKQAKQSGKTLIPIKPLRKSSSTKLAKTENKSELKRSGSLRKGTGKGVERDGPPGKPVKRSASLYAHIKSTIPKPSPKKK